MADDTFLVPLPTTGFCEAVFSEDEIGIQAGECFAIPESALPVSFEGTVDLVESIGDFNSECFQIAYPAVKLGTISINSDDAFRTFVFEIKLGVRNHEETDDTFEIYNVRPTTSPEYIGEDTMQQGDIKITFLNGITEVEVTDTDLEKDAGFETAMLISLFSDARLTLDEINQAHLNDNDLRGYWADALSGENTGSKLRLLSRSKVTPKLLDQIISYAKEAWQWMIDEGAVKEFKINAQREEDNSITISVQVYRPNAIESSTFKFSLNWSAQLSGA